MTVGISHSILEEGIRSRRSILKAAGAFAGLALAQGCARNSVVPLAAAPPPPPVRPASMPAVAVTRPASPPGVDARLFERARAALTRHGSSIRRHDRIAVADFDYGSESARFQFIDLESGVVSSMRVAHGSGSDPAHSGRLQRFSNVPDSNATSEGAFVTDDYYVGKHGRSQRLVGLDPTNDMALSRAIVIHGAWYANPDMIAQHGKLGRSQGCFAVAEGDLARVFDILGKGRMLYAGKA